MNQPFSLDQLPPDDETWARYVQTTARRFTYPPTPDIATTLRGKLRPAHRFNVSLILVRAAAVIVLLLAGLFAIPELRASVLEFLQIGGIRILLVTIVTPTPTPDPALQDAVLHNSIQTTLAEAQEQVAYLILLPSYPPELGEPNQVYVRSLDSIVALVWLRDDDPNEIDLILYHLPYQSPNRQLGLKTLPELVQETNVGDRPAVWVEGEHWLRFEGSSYLGTLPLRRVVYSVLIWAGDAVTYRLETTLTMEEAVRIAESLR